MPALRNILLVEPISKTPYPPLGLMKISSMLKKKYGGCSVFGTVGMEIPPQLVRPTDIYITTLFTWDLDIDINTVYFYKDKYPRAEIHIGGIAATLLPDYIRRKTGVDPHIGLLKQAERCSPDYSLNFGRKIDSSLTLTTRGCPHNCHFCNVKTLEPTFLVRKGWEKDINPESKRIVFWDNNFLASPNLEKDCRTLEKLGKICDFNQGLDARRYTASVAKMLSRFVVDPIRFSFDDISREKALVKAINIAKKHSTREIRVYVLYNFKDTPDEFYYRVNLLNMLGVLSFPMEYRSPTHNKRKLPGKNWDVALLRGLKLSLLYYYRRGMITESRKSFLSIYGKTPKQFVSKLYDIFEYDKKLKRKKPQKAAP